AGMILLVNAAKRIAQDTGAAVVIVHHPSKSDPAGLRGHGSLSGAVDTTLAVTVEEGGKVRRAALTKSRDFSTGQEVIYLLDVVTLPETDQWGDPRTTVVVKATDAPAKK